MHSLDASSADLWAQYHAWLIGFALLCLSSYTRFNIPLTSRSSTTWGRYHSAMIVYVMTTLMVWIILANTPQLLKYLSSQTPVDPAVNQFAAPLYAALALTVLVSSLKPFRDIDERLRKFFQDLASIPWEAQRLSNQLRARTWLPTQERQQRVRELLRSADFEPHDISFANDRGPQAVWTKLAALNDYLKGWKTDRRRRFAAFYYEEQADFQNVSTEYDTLEGRARRVFRLVDTLKAFPDGAQLAAVERELLDQFIANAITLEKHICDLISRALLQSTLTDKARRDECESMGFFVNTTPSHLFDRMLLLYIILWAWYVVSLTLAGRQYAFLTGTIIPTMYVGAVLIAFRVKRWPWARRTGVVRPIRGYVTVGAVACAFSLLMSFGLGVLQTLDVLKTIDLVRNRWWPWSVMALCTAVATAYNMDNRERARLRWLEAVGQATVGIVCAWFVYIQLKRLVAPPPSAVRVILSATFTGGLIGWFAPTWYREPETVTLEYKGCMVRVNATLQPNGDYAARIDCGMTPHRWSAIELRPLPFVTTFESAEEAIARAIDEARKQIDAGNVTPAHSIPNKL